MKNESQMRRSDTNLYADASKKLLALEMWFCNINESAADFLKEARKEFITLHRLKVPGKLRKVLYTTNQIESIFSGVRDCEGNIKRYRGSKMIQRWLATVLLHCESAWRILGFQTIEAVVATIKKQQTDELATLRRKVVTDRGLTKMGVTLMENSIKNLTFSYLLTILLVFIFSAPPAQAVMTALCPEGYVPAGLKTGICTYTSRGNDSTKNTLQDGTCKNMPGGGLGSMLRCSGTSQCVYNKGGPDVKCDPPFITVNPEAGECGTCENTPISANWPVYYLSSNCDSLSQSYINSRCETGMDDALFKACKDKIRTKEKTVQCCKEDSNTPLLQPAEELETQ